MRYLNLLKPASYLAGFFMDLLILLSDQLLVIKTLRNESSNYNSSIKPISLYRDDPKSESSKS